MSPAFERAGSGDDRQFSAIANFDVANRHDGIGLHSGHETILRRVARLYTTEAVPLRPSKRLIFQFKAMLKVIEVVCKTSPSVGGVESAAETAAAKALCQCCQRQSSASTRANCCI